MRKSDLILFKEKYGVNDYFVSIVESLFDKLVDLEYIPKSKVSHYTNIFIKNVKEIVIGKANKYDYKSGYYDANKKELYIKNDMNIPAVYLRILYAITTKEIESEKYMSGYSITNLRKDSYKLEYGLFGFNRAVISNLVYKLCNILPSSFQIKTVEKTYTHDFLGFKIEALNELYALEGKILSELCFALEIDPELLYSGLFSKDPVKHLNKLLARKKFESKDEFFKLFDDISRNYNTYNKLSFLSQKLNNNYLEYKKNVLEGDVDKIKKEQELIEQNIIKVLSDINKDVDYDDDEFEVTAGLAETLEKLEEGLIKDLIHIQDILADNIIKTCSHLPTAKYAAKLKIFNDLLVIPNPKLAKQVQDTILFKLMPEDEITGINLIQKIKYAIIDKILSDSDYSNISNSFAFYNLTSLEDGENGTAVVLLTSEKKFAKILQIKGLNNRLSNKYNYELNYIPLDNLKYIMNSSYSSSFIGDVEALYTSLRNSFEDLSDISLENVFVFEYDNKKYVVAYNYGNVKVMEFKYAAKHYKFYLLPLSEQYKVFGKTTSAKPLFKSNLPVLYKNKKG